jgi:hypothetical protein
LQQNIHPEELAGEPLDLPGSAKNLSADPKGVVKGVIKID